MESSNFVCPGCGFDQETDEELEAHKTWCSTYMAHRLEEVESGFQAACSEAEALRTALAEAQRERDEARMARDHWETEHGAEKERRLGVERENEELRADRERLEWLLQNERIYQPYLMNDVEYSRKLFTREHIDAARREETDREARRGE